ncbi:MAG: hypothetical protein A3C30_02105 [Candidatus Levybacteria bacterium RIFCSPHIGHO2_02_FULL_40_18]|nr:MAG: hypothetical protein A2869_04485 [Candidatus Levybacteria bacterium RIFCSPHIGHO2_01_FULL_40_58]OGH26783.1 MAG: hypothetical protein A3C30_02105 [Candidatus Levybacteria bacterium RIFCSPHIGHO2_02_FULL_40_18]OGH31718.1 MAG: hypothetical protein A3E43_01825 [Candidatus Levybacteria bacterium RIFCSPHIGHO2_12_FULL_40_31]OGH40618.1 MAG: hypothetical protein A2894_00375 [Candidatus Levybacteria bacterium RIFCSPLOWO2_01_FULL_40_64]OGH48790.1 MAG: hypothetical protein A3I54_04000 [Candidatus Lev
MKEFRKYIRVWWLLTIKSFQVAFTSRFGVALFVFGKLFRLGFFLLFLVIIEQRTKVIVGYSLWEIILFFATFNLIDVFSQFFLREVYKFRWYIVSGDFDFFLTRPLSPLFRSLFGGGDPLDIPILCLSIVLVAISVINIGNVSFANAILYLVLVANGLLIALAFHIFVLAVGVLTTEVDNTIWLYRDLTQMGRLPVDIYQQPLRALITFAVPVGIMITYPSKAILGLLSPQAVLISFIVGGVFLWASILFWRYSLKNYSSASS